MLRASDIFPGLDSWAPWRPEQRVYMQESWNLLNNQYAGAAFYSPLLPSSWLRASRLGSAVEELHRRRAVQFASRFAGVLREWEASSAVTTVGALSLAPLEAIAGRLWNSLTVDSTVEKLIHEADPWRRYSAPLDFHNTCYDYELQTSQTNFLTFSENDQALHTTLTAPLWTLPFRELPFVLDFISVPNAVAYIFYGIGLVRDVIAGRALRYGVRRRRHRAMLSSALRRTTRVAPRFWKAILFQHQRRSAMSADADAHEASLSLVHQGEIADPFVGRRMLNVYPGKFTTRHNCIVRSQSVCGSKHRNRCSSICSNAGKKAVGRLARYSRSVA